MEKKVRCFVVCVCTCVCSCLVYVRMFVVCLWPLSTKMRRMEGVLMGVGCYNGYGGICGRERRKRKRGRGHALPHNEQEQLEKEEGNNKDLKEE